MHMRVLLIYPPFLEKRLHEDDIRPVPIGLYHVAAALRETGCEVALLNLNAGPAQPERVTARVAAFRPRVVGFSILNANRWGGIDIARRVKGLDPAIVTVFGGIGASFLWEHLLTHFAAIDYVVIGEGEQTFPELVRRLGEGNDPDPGSLAGMAFRRGGKPVRTPCAPLAPDLDGLPDPTRHFTFQHLSLTRGCPENCRFCGSPGFWGRRVRRHSPTRFVDQVERLAAHGESFLYVSDDTFTLHRPTVLEVCQEIVSRGIAVRWAAISRVDTVDEEMLGWMRRAGCIQVSYGIESADSEVRRFLGKRLARRDVAAAFAATRRCGILPRAYFIYGCPGETRRTVRANLDLMAEIKPLAAIFYILDIYPGTRLYEDYLERSGRTDDLWLEPIEDILYYETDPALDAETVREHGRLLRDGFHGMLPSFAADIDLLDDPHFHPLHADFLSRLAMTFHQGDYAAIDAIPDKTLTAERLYRRALAFHPDARAFLGLGMLSQQRGDFAAAGEVLGLGVDRFPGDAALQACLAVNDMNREDFDAALRRLRRLAQTPQVRQLIAQCRTAGKGRT